MENGKNIKLWLDDVRPMPSGYNLHIKTAHEAISIIEKGNVSEVSLDHDLGEEENGTGYDVAKFIEEKAFLGEIPKLIWNIHSANPVGVMKMEMSLRNADRFWERHK